jgi:hypothetical protein
MRIRASLVVGVVALATCIICPVLEMFDQWDHTLQTGTDSEYIFVLLALCVGALFILARLNVTIFPRGLESSSRFLRSHLRNQLLGVIHPVAIVPVVESPPLTLRI